MLGKRKENLAVGVLLDIIIPGSLFLLHSVILQHIARCFNLEPEPTSKFNLENLKNRLNISWQIKHFEITLLARWLLLKIENVNILQEGEFFFGRYTLKNIERKYWIWTQISEIKSVLLKEIRTSKRNDNRIYFPVWQKQVYLYHSFLSIKQQEILLYSPRYKIIEYINLILSIRFEMSAPHFSKTKLSS